ncbi:ligand-binding sensor domain-containing protein [Arcicella rosea]|uniref:T9SS type A sorting domain-containing protein n=1 Tax=Arcicella rosea TaxID=502909 RepID=UPI00345DE7E7
MNKVLQTLILFTFYFFSLNTTHAQQWKAYSSFSQANCFFTAQDSTLWIGTSGGILHYDKDYQLLASYNQNNGLDSIITSITQDVQGNIWAYYNEPFNGYFKTYIFDGNVWISNQDLGKRLIADKPLLFYAKDGSKWISYDKGKKFIQVGKDSVYTSYDWETNGINYFNNKSLIVDSKGNFWVKNEKSLLTFDGKKWNKYDYNNSSLPNTSFSKDAVIDQNDNIFLANNGGIYKFNIPTNTCDFISIEYAQSLCVTKDNKVLVSGFVGENYALYQLKGDKLSVFVPNVYAINIYEDFRGNLLLGGYARLNLFDGNSLKDFPLPKNNLSSNVISKIVSDTKNNILIQPYSMEIQYLKNTNDEVIDITDNGYTIAQGEGDDLWVSERTSLTQIKQDNGLKLINHPLLGVEYGVEKIVKDKNQHIWALDYQYSWSTNRYQYLLFYYDKSKWTTFVLENEIIDIAANPNGGLYILNSKGVFTHDRISMKASNYLNIPKNPQRFVSNANLDLYIIAKKIENFEGDIYQLVGNKFDKIVTPDEFRIMASYYFSDFMIDSKGNFWSVGNKIQRYDGKTLTTFNSPFRSTNQDYFSTITNAIHESKDGKIWLGSYTGLTSLIVDCKNPLPKSLRTEKTDGFGTGKSQLSVNQSSALSFVWQISKDKGITWRAITNFDSSYAGHRTNQLTVNQVKIRDNNIVYRCLVNGECNSVLSDTVSIQAKQCELPQTTLQPTAQSTTEKSSAQFVVNASSASAYQWQVSTDKGVTWNMISSSDTLYRGQQTNTLNLTSASLSQNTYQYRCEIKNDCYTLYSNAAPLEVTMILGLDNFERTVQAYPNPANDKIYVKVPAKTYTLTLVDSNGSIVKQVSNQDYINVKDIPNGLYLLLIESGKERQSVKVQVLK